MKVNTMMEQLKSDPRTVSATIYPYYDDDKFTDTVSVSTLSFFNDDGSRNKGDLESGLHFYHSGFNKIEQGEVMSLPVLSLMQFVGSAKMMVNAARVSYYGANHEKSTFGSFTEQDRRLIMRLFNDNHGSPSEQNLLTFRIVIPNPIMKQVLKHRTGVSVNEQSTRYSEIADYIYVPNRLFKQSSTNHQGSSLELISDHDLARHYMLDNAQKSFRLYHTLINSGMAKETARMILPCGFYTQAYISFNLRSLIHFVGLRLDRHAQYEIRQYALMMMMATFFAFPEIVEILIDEKCNIFNDEIKEKIKQAITSMSDDFDKKSASPSNNIEKELELSLKNIRTR